MGTKNKMTNSMLATHMMNQFPKDSAVSSLTVTEGGLCFALIAKNWPFFLCLGCSLYPGLPLMYMAQRNPYWHGHKPEINTAKTTGNNFMEDEMCTSTNLLLIGRFHKL
jgi:hypothetical protein